MKAYKIDPRARTLTEVEYDGSPVDFLQHFHYNTMEVREVNEQGDCVLLSGISLDNPKAEQEGVWGIYCHSCQKVHTYAGLALIFNRDREEPQVLHDVCRSIEEFREVVKWSDVFTMENVLGILEDLFRNVEETKATHITDIGEEKGDNTTLH